MTRARPQSIFDPAPATGLADEELHTLIAGNSGSGKTGCLKLIAQTKVQHALNGFHSVDPEGELAQHIAEYIANPANGLSWRKVHYLHPASTSETFGLALLYVGDRTPQLCHEAALRTRTIFEQVLNFGVGDYGPRLSKLFQLACFGLALTGRPLIDLPELFTLGAARLRELIGDAYPYQFMSEEWRSLDVLSERNPNRFLEYTESITSRLMPTFGNPRLRRIFGQDKGIDLARVLAGREVVLLDLSGLEHKDAVLIGTSYISLLYHEAIQRPPNRCARACLMVDELFDYLTPDLARGFDRFRKHMVQLIVAIQRLGQLQTKASDGVDASVLNAVLTNTGIKIVFGGLEPNDAEYMARVLFTGHLDLCEWKDNSARPVAVGQDKRTTANWSRAEMEAQSEMTAHTRSRSRATAHGTSTTEATSSGTAVGTGANSGQVLTPPLQLFGPNAPNASIIPTPLSQSRGINSSEGTFAQTSHSTSESFTEIETEGEADTVAFGRSYGTSKSEGGSEVYVTRYQWMPSQLYSLPEQLHRLTGELMNLPKRDCFLKIGGQRPVHTRTVDLQPTFRSLPFRTVILPLFLAASAARSPYIRSADEVDVEIAARFAPELPKPEKPEPNWIEPEPFNYPDPPPPPDTPRIKPKLRIIHRHGDDSR